jgi:hypothetical protein
MRDVVQTLGIEGCGWRKSAEALDEGRSRMDLLRMRAAGDDPDQDEEGELLTSVVSGMFDEVE